MIMLITLCSNVGYKNEVSGYTKQPMDPKRLLQYCPMARVSRRAMISEGGKGSDGFNIIIITNYINTHNYHEAGL